MVWAASVSACVLGLLALPAMADGLKVSVVSRADNDLLQMLSASGIQATRYDAVAEALDHAPADSSLLVLAGDYPAKPTSVDDAFFQTAKAKHLRLFVEFPAAVPGLKLGAIKTTDWERAVVASD